MTITQEAPSPRRLCSNIVRSCTTPAPKSSDSNTVRVVTSTSVVDTQTGVTCDGTELSSPYTFRAIGDPEALANAIGIAGGVGSTLRVQYSAKVNVEKKDKIVISAIAPVKSYSYATTVKEDK